MTESEAADSPPRPLEATLAIGCLVLLSLQQLHEGFLYLFTRKSLGLPNLQDAWVILLVLFLGSAAGLWNQSRTAWRLTVGAIGLIAAIHVSQSLTVIRLASQAKPPITIGCAFRPDFDPFPLYWLIAKSAFLVAAPSLLLLGRLRQTLAR